MYIASDGSATYSEVQKLVAADGSVQAFFGISVAVYNNTVIVGALNNAGKLSKLGSAIIET